jgi:hypothetical protein
VRINVPDVVEDTFALFDCGHYCGKIIVEEYDVGLRTPNYFLVLN